MKLGAVSVALLAIVVIILSISLFTHTLSFAAVTERSMEPNIRVGSLVIVVKGRQYAKGDVIFFLCYVGGKRFAIIHRIHEVISHEGETLYRTKGDASDSPDPFTITEESIVGKAVFVLPEVGGFLLALRGYPLLLSVFVASIYLSFEFGDFISSRGQGEPSPDELVDPSVVRAIRTFTSIPGESTGLLLKGLAESSPEATIKVFGEEGVVVLLLPPESEGQGPANLMLKLAGERLAILVDDVGIFPVFAESQSSASAAFFAISKLARRGKVEDCLDSSGFLKSRFVREFLWEVRALLDEGRPPTSRNL